MKKTGIILAGAFAALSACSPVQELVKPEPLPEFTPQEKADIILTAQFLSCTTTNIERIGAVHPNDKTYVMEFCSNMTGFSDDTFGNVMDQMTIKYGDDWPDMLENISDEFSLDTYNPPLIPNNLDGFNFE